MFPALNELRRLFDVREDVPLGMCLGSPCETIEVVLSNSLEVRNETEIYGGLVSVVGPGLT